MSRNVMNIQPAGRDNLVDRFTDPSHVAIAIVGMACRLPGSVNNPEEFWNFICEKRCGITEVPASRWHSEIFYDPDPDGLAGSVSKWAGFIDDIVSFDNSFFGISPREAASMDPQQRLLLENVFEAMQDAKIPIEQFQATKTGVFVGVSQSDYRLIQELRLSSSEIFAGTGYALCINANRISHRFGLTGPSYAVDTACSSSMVALDQACLNIRTGACDAAIVSGVNVLAHPTPFVAFSKAGMLSNTGVVSTFDSQANGYVRGEGVGTVILKTLEAALENGDSIHAVIEATAVNQDGYTSTLTAPNQDAQRDMLNTLCERANVAPSDVGFVEAHGTGTPIGDPIEAGAIGDVFGKHRSGGPVYVGSVKPNIGHLEPAAGISGLIKAAMAVKKGKVPPNINFTNPNAAIPLDVLNIDIPTDTKDFPKLGQRRYAVVNSFGFGGTNASAILSEPPRNISAAAGRAERTVDQATAPDQPVILPLAAATQESLRALALDLAAIIETEETAPLHRLVSTIAARTLNRSVRAAIIANDRDQLRRGLRSIASDETDADAVDDDGPIVISGEGQSGRRICFVFTGQGSQWWAMGRQLLLHNEDFRRAVEAYETHFVEASGWSIIEELLKDEDDSRIHDTTVTQPALFALQSGLVALWRKYGVEPDCVLGHSIGEAAAMHTAGGLSLKSAAEFLQKRGAIRDELREKGAMAAVGADLGDVELLLENEEKIDIAAVNAPGLVTITGQADAIDDFVERFKQDYPGKTIRKLAVDTAWHSYQLDDADEWFRREMKPIDWKTPSIPFISTVTGKFESCFDNEYGWRNLRCPVLFQHGIQMALEYGVNTFVEIGPHNTLAGPISATCMDSNAKFTLINSLDRDRDDRTALLVAVAQLYTSGKEIDWSALSGPPDGALALPAYPWSKKTHWKDSEESRHLLEGRQHHPLLGVAHAGAVNQWKSEISLVTERYLVDHRLQQECIFPAAGYIEMFLAAGRRVYGEVPIEISDTRIHDALFVGENDEIIFHTILSEERNFCRTYSHLRDDDPASWTLRAEGVVRPCQSNKPKPVSFDPSTTRKKKIELEYLYDVEGMEIGVNYGPAFRTVTDIWMDRKTTSVEIEKSRQIENKFERYFTHPAMLDACLQITDPRMTQAKIRRRRKPGDPAYLPVGAQTIRFYAPFPEKIRVHAEQIQNNREDTAQGGFVVTDLNGNVIFTMHGLINRSLRYHEKATPDDDLKPESVVERYVELSELAQSDAQTTSEAGTWLVLCDEDTVAGALSKCADEHDGKVLRFKKSDAEGALADWLADKITECGETGELRRIVYAWGLDTGAVSASTPTVDLLNALEPKIHDLVALGQALDEARDMEVHPDVWILSKRARAIPGLDKAEVRHLVNAPLVALTRTLAAESQEFRVRQIDLSASTELNVQLLSQILSADSNESEYLLRGDKLFVPRLQRLPLEEAPGRKLKVGDEDRTNFQVTMDSAGIIDNLRLAETPIGEIGPDEVRVKVAAVGLNFRDIMAATGLLPREAEDAPAWRTLGLEFGAEVRAVGETVSALKPGDRVMGMAKSCLQHYLTLPATALTKIPKHLKLEEAATIPSAYATAYYALHRVGRLRAGERILIHVATGGVGLAAVQIAQHLGAEIFATAGSPRKRSFLRKLGIKHVMNSRSLEFADEVMKATQGEGVDVVLNSLPGDYIKKGLDIIAPYGRFLEIGKRDVYADSAIGLKALRSNVSISIIDLAAMGLERPKLLGEIFKELTELFNKRKLNPLPHKSFPVSKVADAFKYMSQAKHIGKLVVTFDQKSYEIVENRNKPFVLSRDASYVVTGGSRGFGITVADWLSRSGAGQVLLTSRSGAVDGKYRSRIRKMEKRGTKVSSIALDVTDQTAVEKFVREHSGNDFPIRGIIHGAAVIEDGLLSQLDQAQIERVVRPKVAGAWNLHLALRKNRINPDFVVNFSSVAQALGSPGQGNYVAANAFLDAFSQYLDGSGTNCKTIDWGVLGQSGFVTRNDALESYLESVGMFGVSDKDACGAMETIIRTSLTDVLFASLDWKRVARANPALGNSARIAPMQKTASASASEIRQELLTLEIEERSVRLAEFLKGEVGKVLKIEPDQVPADRPMTELGLDSLSSFELKNRIETELDMTLPLSKFLQAPDITELSEIVSQEMQRSANQQAAKLAASKSTNASDSEVSPDDEQYLPSDRQVALLAASKAPMTTASGQTAFETVLSVLVKPALQVTKVEAAVNLLADRHPLMTAIATTDGSLSITGQPPQLECLPSWSAASAKPLDIGSGELLRITQAPASNEESVIAIRCHVGLADRWSLHLLLEELLTLCVGKTLRSAPSKRDLCDLFERRRYDVMRPDSVLDRSFWHYATSPIPQKIDIGSRRRALVQPKLGCAGMPASSVRFDIDVGEPELLRDKLLNQALRSLPSAMQTTSPMLVALTSTNRLDTNHDIFGTLESQHPIVTIDDRLAVGGESDACLNRVLSALPNHIGYDLFTYCAEFADDIAAADAAPFQISLNYRDESDVHPLEGALGKGNASIGGFAVRSMALSEGAIISDVEFEFLHRHDRLEGILRYDDSVIERAFAETLCRAIEMGFMPAKSAIAV